MNFLLQGLKDGSLITQGFSPAALPSSGQVGWRWPQKPPLGAMIDWSHPLAAGLVGAWVFSEGTGTTVGDLARVYGADGALTNGPTWTIGPNGAGLSVASASSQYVACGSIPSLSGASSASIFVMGRRVSGAKLPVGALQSVNNQFGVSLYSDNLIYFMASTGAAATYGTATAPTGDFSAGLSYDGTQATNATRLTGIVNGVPQSLTFTGTIGATLGTGTVWQMGHSTAGAYYGDGRLDLVLVWTGRSLGLSDFTSLQADPWQFFAPPGAWLAQAGQVFLVSASGGWAQGGASLASLAIIASPSGGIADGGVATILIGPGAGPSSLSDPWLAVDDLIPVDNTAILSTWLASPALVPWLRVNQTENLIDSLRIGTLLIVANYSGAVYSNVSLFQIIGPDDAPPGYIEVLDSYDVWAVVQIVNPGPIGSATTVGGMATDPFGASTAGSDPFGTRSTYAGGAL